MKEKFNRIKFVLKWSVRLFKTVDDGDSKVVYLNLKNAQNGNYYFDLIKHFQHAGFSVRIFLRFRFIYAYTKYFKAILLDNRVLPYLFSRPGKKDILVKDFGKMENGSIKSVLVRYDSFHEKVEYDITFPFGISPIHYIENNIRSIKELRSQEKKMRIFFSGNSERSTYDHSIFKLEFGMLNRWKALNTITTQLDPSLFVINQVKPERSKLNLRLWNWSPSQNENLDFRINNSEWFQQLAEANFFLALPGIRMPLCYNAVEAMSVGTIPILAYNQYFDPPLEHMVNCVRYSTEEDLISKIRLVLDLDEQSIAAMSKEVITYYDKFQSPGNFVRSILDNSSNQIVVKMYCGNQSLLASGMAI